MTDDTTAAQCSALGLSLAPLATADDATSAPAPLVLPIGPIGVVVTTLPPLPILHCFIGGAINPRHPQPEELPLSTAAIDLSQEQVAVLQARSLLDTVPLLSAAAPTLAKHLGWALERLRDVPVSLTDADVSAYNDAVAALRRLPFVRRATREIDGVQHVRDQHGRWVPEQLAGAAYLVEDDYVSQVASAALQLNASLARFKALSMSEGIALVELMGQDYGIKVGGDAGNVSFYTYDRLYQVKFARADRIAFGAQIQAARELLEQWVREEAGSPALKLLINRAFGFDQEGKIRAAEVFRLATFDIPGDTWAKAMQAIRDSVQIIGKAEYMRVYRRDGRGKYELIPLDLASV